MKAILAILLIAVVACEAEPQLEFAPIPFIKCMLADGQIIGNIKKVIEAIKEKDLLALITIVPAIVDEVTKCWNAEVELQFSINEIIEKIKSMWNSIPAELRQTIIDLLLTAGKAAAKAACEALVKSKFPGFESVCQLIQ